MDMTQEAFDKLQADNAALLAESQANSAKLAEALESIGKLEKNNREILKEKSEAKTAAERMAHEAAKASGDIGSIEASYQEKIAALQADKEASENNWRGIVNSITVDKEAFALASDIAIEGSAEALLPHIKTRLSVEIVEGHPKLRVLGKDGKPSAMTVDELRHEIQETKPLAPLISGSKANGTGEVHTRGVTDTKKTIKRDAFNALSAPEQDAQIASGVIPVD